MTTKNQQLAPIVFFVYNRLYHTKKTLEALSKNTLASQSKLYIYADGPKDLKGEFSSTQVRNYLKDFKKNNPHAFESITIIEREKNYGLSKNIIYGIDDVVKKHGRVIVIEDDILTSPYTLQYLNEALDFYEHEKQVYHIAAWNDLVNMNIGRDTFLWRAMNCWGWATWQDRWDKFQLEFDPHALFGSFSKKDIYKFTRDGLETMHWSFAQMVMNTPYKTWDIYWYATIFKNNGLCLNPTESLIRNIGNDYSGEHSSEQIGLMCQKISDKTSWTFQKNIVEDKKAFAQIKHFLAQEKVDAISYTRQIMQSVEENKNALFSPSNHNPVKVSLPTQSKKDKIRKLIKKCLLNLWPPYALLETTRKKSAENEARILNLQRETETLRDWLAAFGYVEISKYLQNSFGLSEFLNITSTQLMRIALFIKKEKPKVVLEIGSGISTYILASIIKSYKGTLISIDHNKNRCDAINNALLSSALNKSAKVYQTQIISQTIAGLEWFAYDFSVLEHKNINMAILSEETENIQGYSTYASLLLIEDKLAKNALVLTDRLSANNKIIPLWEEYSKDKNYILR